jgi:uncharacterized protein YifN (PemK superfamily)
MKKQLTIKKCKKLLILLIIFLLFITVTIFIVKLYKDKEITKEHYNNYSNVPWKDNSIPDEFYKKDCIYNEVFNILSNYNETILLPLENQNEIQKLIDKLKQDSTQDIFNRKKDNEIDILKLQILINVLTDYINKRNTKYKFHVFDIENIKQYVLINNVADIKIDKYVCKLLIYEKVYNFNINVDIIIETIYENNESDSNIIKKNYVKLIEMKPFGSKDTTLAPGYYYEKTDDDYLKIVNIYGLLQPYPVLKSNFESFV